MKFVRKKLCLLLALVFILLTGCADESGSYPVMTPVDSSSMALSEIRNNTWKISFPADGWCIPEGSEGLVIAGFPRGDGYYGASVSVQTLGRFSGKLNNRYKNKLVEASEKEPSYLTVEVMEVRSLVGAPVIYCEVTAAYTEENIEALLEAGTLTEENIENLGGREAMLSIPPGYQIILYTVVDGQLIICTGIYDDAAQKQDVVEAMTVMISTAEIL